MLTICIVLWVNQRLTIKPDYEEDKYFLTKGIVLFSIPTAAMLISNELGLDMVYTALIFYPISFFVTWKLSQFLAKKEGN